jgi:hypothetical protein
MKGGDKLLELFGRRGELLFDSKKNYLVGQKVADSKRY